MTALSQARAEQSRAGDWLRSHRDWRDSDELVDVEGHGTMRKRTAYAGVLAGAEDWIIEEYLIGLESGGGGRNG